MRHRHARTRTTPGSSGKKRSKNRSVPGIHLFQTATETLRDAFRTRLALPDGKLGAIAAVHTFGDYLIFHPHLHVLAADGLFAPDGRFHCMPVEDLAPAIELFRHRFLHALREAKLISPKKLADLLAWKHSGFHIHDGGERPVPAHDSAGRKRLAEYLLRHPFSLQKITWNETTKTVIYRSKRHHTTKRNFEIFKAPDFIAAALLHLPPKGQQTVRYYGVYSNKTRGLTSPIPDHIIRPPAPPPDQQPEIRHHQSEILLIPAPPKQSARDMRPLWRDLILQVWGGDPQECPCCKGILKPVRQVIHREQIEFFLRLHGLWEGLIQLPRPPPPPFDIDTMEPIEPPWLAIKENDLMSNNSSDNIDTLGATEIQLDLQCPQCSSPVGFHSALVLLQFHGVPISCPEGHSFTPFELVTRNIEDKFMFMYF